MARFKATIKGSRGDASRLGDADSGLTATVNGPVGGGVGVRVEARAHGPVDVFELYMTGGGRRDVPDVRIGDVRLIDGVLTFTPELPPGGWPPKAAPPAEGRQASVRANTGAPGAEETP